MWAERGRRNTGKCLQILDGSCEIPEETKEI